MARRILRKHSQLFGRLPAQIPMDRSFTWTLSEYDNEVGRKNMMAAGGKLNEVVELSDDDEDYCKKRRKGMLNELRRDEEEVVAQENNLVNSLLRLVSDEGGRERKAIRISLSSFNGFVSDSAVDVELLDSNRIYVEECILRYLVEPILEEYLNMKKNHKSIHHGPSKEFLGRIADILSTKIGLAIYK
jgi:hypothetical protein